ncbi:pheromone A receptor-domain-containing protein [Cantharellus anzutake]|uniref:pheromone A receptor-domain-containing protein n=1 Tax=Cantharellus anzutake TaxID=1750568 RepID=UPI0019054746|nr:pheromone A receptor-domain-containing protein [Cantharellus anzutake]KAF8332027.1 pheromone A receptor-domain-containing protein [Cantharellus anzutake]
MARYDLTAMSFLAAVVVIIPLPWHWRAKNIATLTTMAWLFILNLFRGINTILWADTVVVKVPVFCDIGVFFWTASYWGLPASAVCITRHLAGVTSPNFTPSGRDEKRRRFWFEMTMCVFMPFVYAGLHFINQGHRFDIMEEIGCQVTTYFSWGAVWLVYFPSILLSVIAAIYASIAMYWLMQRRAQFRELLAASQSGLTTSRYLRLMGLGLTEVIGGLGLNIYVLCTEIRLVGIQPWVSWEYVHWHFLAIHQFPKAIIVPELQVSNKGTSTIAPVAAYCFFLFFAFGEEAVSEYKKNWVWIKVHIFRKDPSTMVGSALPSFIAYVLLPRIATENYAIEHSFTENRREPSALLASMRCLLERRRLVVRNGSPSLRVAWKMTMTIVYLHLTLTSKLQNQPNFPVPHYLTHPPPLDFLSLLHHARRT